MTKECIRQCKRCQRIPYQRGPWRGYWYECKVCEACGPRCETEDEAVKGWNFLNSTNKCNEEDDKEKQLKDEAEQEEVNKLMSEAKRRTGPFLMFQRD